MKADIALMTWTQMVSDLALPSPSWTNANQDMHPGNRQCYMTWQGLRPGRLNSILGGCRPGQVSRSCFRNLLCKTPHSQAIQTHGWQQFRASYLLLQELFSEPQRQWAQTEAQRKKKKKKKPKECTACMGREQFYPLQWHEPTPSLG